MTGPTKLSNHQDARETLIQEIAEEVATRFRCFGKGSGSNPGYNPIVAALKNDPPTFAMGVDVEEVVRFILLRAPNR